MEDLELFNRTHRQIFCYNEKIGHLYIPNLNARIIHETGGYFVKTNSQGFRADFDFTEKKNKKKGLFFLAIQTQQQMALVIMKDFQILSENILMLKFLILLYQDREQTNSI